MESKSGQRRDYLSNNCRKIKVQVERPLFFIDNIVKNNPSSTSRFIRAVEQTCLAMFGIGVVTFLLMGIFSYFNIAPFGSWLPELENTSGQKGAPASLGWRDLLTIAVAVVTICSVCYWNLDSIYGRQWNYLLTFFNKILDVQDPLRFKHLMACLCCDLLETGLWNNSLFIKDFREVVDEAIADEGDAELSKSWSDNKVLDIRDLRCVLLKLADKYRRLEHENVAPVKGMPKQSAANGRNPFAAGDGMTPRESSISN